VSYEEINKSIKNFMHYVRSPDAIKAEEI